MKLFLRVARHWMAGCPSVFVALLFSGCQTQPVYTDPFATDPEPAPTTAEKAAPAVALTAPTPAPVAFSGRTPAPLAAPDRTHPPVAVPAPAATPAPDSKSPASSPNIAPSVKLRVGELVNVTYSDIPTLSPPYEGRVKDDGTITIPPYNQTFMVLGKTTRELEQEIRARYVPKYFLNLTVAIKTQDLYYSVDGEVKRPNRQVYLGEMTVLGAIASAEGFTDYAKKKEVRVIGADGKNRKVNCLKALENPALDVPIFPGDKIVVPRRLF